VGEWHTRAQVSTLLVPKAARTIFWTTYTSSFVQREEVIPPIASVPYCCWIEDRRSAVKAIASSQVTTFQSSSMESRIIGSVTRSV